ncbi:MAG: hypothetical protein CL927_15290 [Deltaproteobacteria bacterium]|nr:hypothetical protein [Deltaproteobacteria bacterium]
MDVKGSRCNGMQYNSTAVCAIQTGKHETVGVRVSAAGGSPMRRYPWSVTIGKTALVLCLSCGDKESSPASALDSGPSNGPSNGPSSGSSSGPSDDVPTDTDTDTELEADADGDGYVTEALGGDDCNDNDPTIHPGAPDTWYDGIDSDCANNMDYDADGDGYAYDEYGGPDCDDADPVVRPDADEDCIDGRDNDCDALIDCEDAECASVAGCFEICTNEIDDDEDGLIDCEQLECMGTPTCPIFQVELTGGLFQRSTVPVFSTYLVDRMYARSLSGHVVAATSEGGSTSCVFSDVSASWGRSGDTTLWHAGFSGVPTGDCGADLDELIPRQMAHGGSQYIGFHGFESPWWRPSMGWVRSSESGWFGNRTLIHSSDNLHRRTEVGYSVSWVLWSGSHLWTWSLDGESHVLGNAL